MKGQHTSNTTLLWNDNEWFRRRRVCEQTRQI